MRLLEDMQEQSDVSPLQRVLVEAFEDDGRSALLVLTELIAPRNEDALCSVVLQLVESIGQKRDKRTDELAPSSPIRVTRRKFLTDFLAALVQTERFPFEPLRRRNAKAVVAPPPGGWESFFDSEDDSSVASNESAGLPPGARLRHLLLLDGSDGEEDEDEDLTEEKTIRDITAELSNLFIGRGHPSLLLGVARTFPRSNDGTSLELSLVRASWERTQDERVVVVLVVVGLRKLGLLPA